MTGVPSAPTSRPSPSMTGCSDEPRRDTLASTHLHFTFTSRKYFGLIREPPSYQGSGMRQDIPGPLPWMGSGGHRKHGGARSLFDVARPPTPHCKGIGIDAISPVIEPTWLHRVVPASRRRNAGQAEGILGMAN